MAISRQQITEIKESLALNDNWLQTLLAEREQAIS
jgi:hypothetical protein